MERVRYRQAGESQARGSSIAAKMSATTFGFALRFLSRVANRDVSAFHIATTDDEHGVDAGGLGVGDHSTRSAAVTSSLTRTMSAGRSLNADLMANAAERTCVRLTRCW